MVDGVRLRFFRCKRCSYCATTRSSMTSHIHRSDFDELTVPFSTIVQFSTKETPDPLQHVHKRRKLLGLKLDDYLDRALSDVQSIPFRGVNVWVVHLFRQEAMLFRRMTDFVNRDPVSYLMGFISYCLGVRAAAPQFQSARIVTYNATKFIAWKKDGGFYTEKLTRSSKHKFVECAYKLFVEILKETLRSFSPGSPEFDLALEAENILTSKILLASEPKTLHEVLYTGSVQEQKALLENSQLSQVDRLLVHHIVC